MLQFQKMTTLWAIWSAVLLLGFVVNGDKGKMISPGRSEKQITNQGQLLVLVVVHQARFVLVFMSSVFLMVILNSSSLYVNEQISHNFFSVKF